MKMSGIAALASIGLSGSAFSKSSENVELQSAERFSQLIDTDFYLSNKDISTPAKLANIKTFPNNSSNGECFSMEFQTPLKFPRENTYQVFHPELGNFDLFLTEGRNGKKRVLLATVNRL